MPHHQFAACAALLGVLALAPTAAAADEMSAVGRLQYEHSLTEMLAQARAERVMAEVEVAFLEERLAADDWALLVFELEDPLVAELVDAWMEARVTEVELAGPYGEEHPDRQAARARIGVLEEAVRREIGSVVEVRRLGLDMAAAKEAKFAEALVESGGGVDEAALLPAFEAMAAQAQALELEARVEAEHHERLLAQGHGEQVARSSSKGGLVVLAKARLLVVIEDTQLALKYGEKHPDRVECAAVLAALDELLAAQAAQAVAASRLKVELLQRQIEALQGLQGQAGQEGTTP